MNEFDELFDVVTPDIGYATDADDDKSTANKKYSSDEALIECINTYGRVDMKKMEQLSGIGVEQLILDLRGTAIFQDPALFFEASAWDPFEGWLLRAQYCCGNILKKLSVAEEAEDRFPGCFECNVSALRSMLPASLVLDEIHVSLGATWVPAEIYADFIADLLHFEITPDVIYNRQLSLWQIEVCYGARELRDSVANHYTYGTVEMSALKIIEQTMNARTAKVFDYVYKYNNRGNDVYEQVLNRPATLAVQEKQKLIIDEFQRWIYADERRREQLEECYNDAFVGFASSPYDGSFLRFPDLNPDITLYPHQKDAIARILLSGENVLLSHDVGTGKTYEMIAGVHELKRMGLSEKNLIVVPNTVLKATVDAHKLLYPDDKILAVFPKDFGPKDRAEVLEYIRDNDYTAVYMAYSSFDMIVMSKDYWINKWQKEIRAIKAAISNSQYSSEESQLKREKKALSKKLSKYALEAVDTPWLTFDALGINTLVVDEAHNYKNIPIKSRTDSIVGMHATGSKKCTEMLEKAHLVDRLILATGTPLTNSLADLFVMQTYLQPRELRFREIDNFDMWINCFGERETNFEIDVDTNGLREMTRFSTFHNLTELMSLFASVCDFHHSDSKTDETPDFEGYDDICVPKSEAQTEYIHDLGERTELIRSRAVKRTEDNLLKITTDGRKCALDVRLVGVEDDGENNKINVCASKIMEIYHRFPDTCQLVFSDIGTPKSAFNVYDCLKQRLVLLGIPEYEIAFIHDATSESVRSRMFAAINAGAIRVVVGSTSKLGTGVNVQEKLIAVHHLSVPWRPADMVQREGRIIRPGNTCEQVYIYRYITEGSFDAYSWQLLENKQRFISSFLSGTSVTREVDDIADAVLSYAEVKALAIGNPLIKKRVETANLLERTKIASRQRQKQLIDLRSVIENAPAQIEKINELIQLTENDRVFYDENRETIAIPERVAFGEELLEAIRSNALREKERLFDEYQGFTVVLPANMMSDKPYVWIRRNGGGNYYLEMDTDKPMGCAQRIDRLLDQLDERIKSLEKQHATIYSQSAEAKTDIERGNPHESKVEALIAELSQIDEELSKENKEAS